MKWYVITSAFIQYYAAASNITYLKRIILERTGTEEPKPISLFVHFSFSFPVSFSLVSLPGGHHRSRWEFLPGGFWRTANEGEHRSSEFWATVQRQRIPLGLPGSGCLHVPSGCQSILQEMPQRSAELCFFPRGMDHYWVKTMLWLPSDFGRAVIKNIKTC